MEQHCVLLKLDHSESDMTKQQFTEQLLPGLVSVTFRSLAPRDIVELVAQARLAGIEWGGDVHVPPGDLARAREVGQMTCDAGLAVAAYGSYYEVGRRETDESSFAQVLDTALALGAPLIRVWAGSRGSADADDAYRRWVAEEACRIAAAAAGAGIAVAFEFHCGTLTDSTASAAALLAATASAGMHCYWQPPVGWTPTERLAALHTVLPYLANLHVYHWATVADRRPLMEGAEEWHTYFTTVASSRQSPCWALLEFVRDDDPNHFLADARALLDLLVRVRAPRSSRI